jgi:hypothetical protein
MKSASKLHRKMLDASPQQKLQALLDPIADAYK